MDYTRPFPQLPDDPGVSEETNFVLDMYSAEIREHAGSVIYIHGMSPQLAERYKFHCYEAATHLTNAADLLRQHYRDKKRKV